MTQFLPPKPIRLLALDLDGTLIGDTLVVSPRAREAIKAARSAGVVVTLATGRTWQETLPYVRQLGLKAPLICHQGALIQQGNRTLYHRTMPHAPALEVIDFALSHGLHVNLYIGDAVYVERITPEAEIYSRYSPELEIQVVGNLRTFMANREPTKLLLVGQQTVLDSWWPALQQRWGGTLQVVRSHTNLVEFTHRQVSKGAALAFLSTHLHIPQREVMAVGDNQNDLSLVQWAGWGVAMGQATPELQLAADYVAPSLAEDGAAVAIERFVLSLT